MMAQQENGGDSKGGKGGNNKVAGLMSVNDLTYVLPPDLSVSVNRTHCNHYFQQSTYTNSQRAICILNSGAHYGDMRLSSLEFGVQVIPQVARTDDTTPTNLVSAWLGRHGSALNLIDSITISSRSGDEIARLNQADLLHYVTTAFRKTEGYLNTVGQGMGYNTTIPSNAAHQNTAFFSIPLSDLSDIFAYGRLTPPQLLSGMRISITWTPPVRAFVTVARTNGVATHGTETNGVIAAVGGTDVITEYHIINPYISMYSVQLTDGVQRALNELSAVNGLEIVYCDWEPTEVAYAASLTSTAQLEVRKAASRALKAFAVTRDTKNINVATRDSYATERWSYRRWQWQLGSLYFPQQPIVASSDGGAFGADTDDTVANSIPESYKHTLIAFGKYKGECAVPMRLLDGTVNDEGFNTTNTIGSNGYTQTAVTNIPAVRADKNGKWGTYANGLSVLGVLLERSDLFNLSGVPINNSRVLSLRVEYDNANFTGDRADGRTLTIFLKYVRLARIFLNNVEVEQ